MISYRKTIWLLLLAMGALLGLITASVTPGAYPAQAQSNVSTITIAADQAAAHEGGLAFFTLTRHGGHLDALTVEVKTWEPDHLDAFGDNETERVHDVHFDASSRVATLPVLVYIDVWFDVGDLELKAQVQESSDSSYQVDDQDTATVDIIDVHGVPAGQTRVELSSGQTSVSEGGTATFTVTRGGETAAPLTVDILVEDPKDVLRGNHWEPVPQIPTQVEFAADSTSETVSIPVPDDQRDMSDESFKVSLVPSADYLIWSVAGGFEVSESVEVTDDDTAQILELNFGKDGVDGANGAEGDTFKIVVKRRAEDVGQTATFTVRVEVERSGPDHVLEEWEQVEGRSRRYRDFPLEITGSDTQVEQVIEIVENGVAEALMTYTADIRTLEDHEGNELGAAEEALYWTVKTDFRGTAITPRDNGAKTGTITLTTDQTTAVEGQEVIFTVTREGGPIGRATTVTVETSEENRETTTDGVTTNPSLQEHSVAFEPWQTTATFRVYPFVDMTVEADTDPLYAEITTVGTSYTIGTPHTATVEINDAPSTATTLSLQWGSGTTPDPDDANATTIDEGGSVSFSVTRTGSTAQDLTVGVEVDDPKEVLRGNHWDSAPAIPSEIIIPAGDTNATFTLNAPDDQRDVTDGTFGVRLLASSDYYLGAPGLNSPFTVNVTDNDTFQALRLQWGSLDSYAEPSWEPGESWVEVDEDDVWTGGPAEGLFYYEDNRSFLFDHDLEEPWPAHFRVIRRAADVGKTVTFTVRVEHNRGWISPRQTDWSVDPVTGNHYKDFELTLTGDQRQVVGRVEVGNNGRPDPEDWEHSVEILRIVDSDTGEELTDEQEAQYWRVREPDSNQMRRDSIAPTDWGWPQYNFLQADPDPVPEGEVVTFTLHRLTGNLFEAQTIQVRTWEPNLTRADGTNPSDQFHTVTFPALASAVQSTNLFVHGEAESQTIPVTTTQDTDYETQDVIKAEIPASFGRDDGSDDTIQAEITDDDLPTITLSAAPASITEGETLTFTLTRGNNTTQDMTVGVTIDDPGGFLEGNSPSQAVAVPSSVIFAAGDVTRDITITPPDDWRDIPDSELTLTVMEEPEYEIIGSNSLTVPVADNDVAPQVGISFLQSPVNEDEELVLVITRTGETKNPLEIPLTAGPEGDQSYRLLVMDAGQAELRFTINESDNDIKGPDVVYKVTLHPGPPEFWTPTGPLTVTGTVLDNDMYLVGVEALETEVNEGQLLTFRYFRTGHTGEAIRVNLERSQTGSAVKEALINETGVFYNISIGSAEFQIAYIALSQDGSDGDATFTVTLLPGDDYEIDPDHASASITVRDVEPLPVISFPSLGEEVQESVGTAEITVDLASTIPVLQPVTVDYQVTEGTTEGIDITESSGTLEFPSGTTQAVIEVPVIQDNLAEGNEQFNVFLSNPVNAVLQDGATSLQYRVIIMDDEPEVSVAAAGADADNELAVDEGTDIVLTLTRTGDTTDTLDAWLQVVDRRDTVTIDYPKVTFSAGSDTAEYTIETVDDRDDLGNYEISVTVSEPSRVGEPRTYHKDYTATTVTVRDTELPKVRVYPASSEDEGEVGLYGTAYNYIPLPPNNTEGENLYFLFQRNHGGRELTVDLEWEGATHFASGTLPATAVLAQGERELTITIPTEDDAVAEDNGDLTVTVKDGTGYIAGNPDAASHWIFDNDGDLPELLITAERPWVNEGEDVVFTVTRTGDTTAALDVNLLLYHTRSGGDHQTTEEDTITIAAGSDSGTITKSTTDDQINYGNASIVAALMPGEYYLDQSTVEQALQDTGQNVFNHVRVWVQDDDRPTVTLGPATVHYEEGDPMEVTIGRTGDTTVLLYVDTSAEITRKYPAPLQDETRLSRNPFTQVSAGESSSTRRFADTGGVGALGATGRIWLVPDSCPDDEADCGAVHHPHVCIDDPGQNTSNCGYQPQYHRDSTQYQQDFVIHNDFMGVRIEADQSSVAEGTAATFTLHRHGGAPGSLAKTLQVEVQVTQEGDYISGTAPTTVTFAANVATATLTVATDDDAVDEADGSITAALIRPSTCNNELTCYAIGEYPGTVWEVTEVTTAVTDDDYLLPTASIADAFGTEHEGTIEFTVSLNQANTQETVTVDWATADDGTATADTAATSGTDYTDASGTVTFAIGETEQTFTVALLDDDDDEYHETFSVTLSNPQNVTLGDATATATIRDDDLDFAVIFYRWPQSAVEGEELRYTIRRLPPLTPGDTLSSGDACFDNPYSFSCFNTALDADTGNTPLTVNIQVTQDGDMISGALPTTVTFEPDSIFAHLVLPTQDDTVAEAASVVTVKALNGAGYSELPYGELGQVPTVRTTVYDNDLTFSINDAAATESAGTLDFTVSLNAPAPEEVSVDVATVDGEATSHSSVTADSLGMDFEAKAETVTFMAGEQNKTFAVTLTDDTIHERNETFSVRLSNPPPYSTLADDAGLGIIVDDEPLLIASVNRGFSRVDEHHTGPVKFKVQLSHPHTTASERNPAVAWRTLPGTATLDDDYQGTGGKLTFMPGVNTAFIEVDIVDDDLFEAEFETFTVELVDVDSRFVTISPTDGSYMARIRDNEYLTASIYANAENVVEGEQAIFTVLLTESVTTEDVQITFETEGDVSAGKDYGRPTGMISFPTDNKTGAVGVLTIPAGQSSGTITYPITLDNVDEDDVEEMEVSLFTLYDGVRDSGLPSSKSEIFRAHETLKSSGISYALSSAFTDILDAGNLTASLFGSPSVTEGGTLTFTITTTMTSDEDVSVEWVTRQPGDTLSLDETAEPDADYTATAGTVAITAGNTSGTFTVTTIDDTLAEGDETFRVELQHASKGTGLPEIIPLGVTEAVGTILDDDADPDGITLSTGTTNIPESAGPWPLDVTVSLDGATQLTVDTPVTLEFVNRPNVARNATLGVDYTTTPVYTAIPAGESSVETTITIAPVDDEIAEGDEIARLTAKSSTLTGDDALGITIEDNDPQPVEVVLAVTPDTLTESSGTTSLAVTATISGRYVRAVDTVVSLTTTGDTATAGTDFQAATGSLTIPAGSLSATGALDLVVLDDAVDEEDETLNVTGTVPGDIDVIADEVTIQDNDTAPTSISLSVTASPITEDGAAVSLPVHATLMGGSARGEDTIVDLSLVDVTATVDEDYTAVWGTASLTIPANELSASTTLTITPVQDTLYEGTESVAARGSNSDPGLPVNGVRLDIGDDDPAPTTIRLDINSDIIPESTSYTAIDIYAYLVGDSTLTTDTEVSLLMQSSSVKTRSEETSFLYPLVIEDGKSSAFTFVILHDLDDDVDDDDEILTLNGTASDPSLRVLSDQMIIANDDTAGVTIWPSSLSVREGSRQSYSIKLDSEPTSDVTVNIDLPADAGFTVNPGSITFTRLSWGKQSVVVTGVQDDDALDEPAAAITHSITSSDSKYKDAATDDVSVTVRDDETPGVTISPTSLTIEEGASAEYTVALDTAPAGDVTVTIGGITDTDLSLSETTLTFTDQDWSTAQTVTVTAEQDDDAVDEPEVTITHAVSSTADSAYDGVTADSVAITVTDDDTVGVTVSPTAITVVAGRSNLYSVVLDSEPAGDVTVTVAGTTGTDLSLDKTTLTFTTVDWKTAQSVEVSAVAAAADATETLTHTVSSTADGEYDSATASSVSVTVLDAPTTPLIQVGVTTSDQELTVPEGESRNYSMILGSQPDGDVVIAIGGVTGTDLSLEKDSLTFTDQNWNTEQTVKVSAGHDDDTTDDTATLTHAASSASDSRYDGVAVPNVAVTVTDDDEPMVTVSFGSATYSVDESDDSTTSNVTENEVEVTVKLSADPERTVTIPITKTDQGGATSADYSGVPASVVFNSGDTEKSFTFVAAHDTVDDDDEKVKLGFGALPADVSEGAIKEAVVSINDDDVPRVTVSFGETGYTVDEGSTVAVKVKLSKDPERTVAVPLTITHFDGVSGADYSGVPGNVTFQAGDTEKSFSFAATQDTVDDDGEYVLIGLGNLPARVDSAAPSQTTVSIIDDDVPAVTVRFDSATYSVDESDDASTIDVNENEVEVTVTLSADPERTVAIPITKTHQGGATSADYSGVPASVTFNSGETEQSFTFAATHDTVDDDGESVKLTFGTLPARVSEGTTKETVVSITDDDLPTVNVSFNAATYTASEGGSVEVKITLSEAPERPVTVPLTKDNQGGASNSDYSGVPANVVFGSNDTEKSFTFTATDDSVDDDDESVKLGFGALPTGVSAGTNSEAVVNIADGDVPTVSASFENATYTVTEGNSVTIKVKLSADPERSVTVPITKDNQGGATSADYSGVPASVVFNAGDTEKTFSFAATDDTEDDDSESVKLGLGTLPEGVNPGTIDTATVSITDDDLPASVSVSFENSAYSVAESDDPDSTDATENEVEVTVKLSADPERTVTIPITKDNQGGASGSDYSGVPASVVFNSGDTEKSFTFSATADTVDDDDESVKLTFGTLPTGVTEGTPKETVVSITDDDLPDVTVTFENDSYSVDEGSSVTIKVVLSAKPERAVAIPISATYLHGVGNGDFSGAPVTLNFGEDDTEKTITFSATDDALDDDGEKVRLNLGTLPAQVSAGTNSQATVSIVDNDDPSVTVSFESATYSVDETDDPDTTDNTENSVTIKVKLSADPERTVTVPITKTDQGGATSADYSGVPTSVVFNSGDTEKSFTFVATHDTVDDDDEKVKLTFGTLPTRVTEGTTKEATISINDDDVPRVTVSFGETGYTVDEGSTVSVKVKLNKDPERTVAVPLTVTHFDGVSGADYSGVPGSVTFQAGDTEKSFSFAATQDTVNDDGEYVLIGLGNLPDRVNSAAPSQTTVSITDDDVLAVTVGFGSATYSVDESDDSDTSDVTENEVEVTVTLSADPERTVTIPITKNNQGGASNSDYSGVPANVVFNSGDTEKSFTFTATHDTVDDDDESVKLTFGTLPTGVSEGTTKETVISINDDDLPAVTVSFGSAAYSVDESDNASTTDETENEVTVKVKLSADPERTVTIPITKTDQGGATSADYSGVPTSVTFNSGDTEKSFTFAATHDTVDDDDEKVKLTFGTLPTGVTEGTTKETVISINDDDVPRVNVSFGLGGYMVAEGGTVAVKVKLSKDPERTVAVPLTVTHFDGVSGADYSGVPGSVTFQAGDTEKSFNFAAADDTVDDDGEYVLIGLGTLPARVSSATPSQTTVSITDDDVPAVTVSFDSGTYSVDEGSSVTVKVQLSVDPERTVTIPLAKTDQGGATSADYSGVPTSVTFNSGDTEKTFSFSAASDNDNDDGESVKLTFGILPAGVSEGATKESVVSITDDDVPAVTVNFASGTYSVAESDDTDTTGATENEVEVTVKLSADPERKVTIPITKDNQGGASGSDYSGVPASVVFNSGDTEKSFTFSATADTVDDDDESVKLAFGMMPTGVSEGTPKETVVSITDDDLPDVTVTFENDSYSVTEGNSVTIKVVLSAKPERAVAIPITAGYLDGVGNADFSGAPTTLNFGEDDTEKTITISAYDDALNDDGEKVRLNLGTLPAQVSAGTNPRATVTIVDNDDPAVTVSFENSAYTVAESDDSNTTDITENEVMVKVQLDADPERTVTIPLTKTNQGGAASADYSGVPANVVFNSGDTEKTFTFAAAHDTANDDGESVKLTFGTLAAGVSEGTPKETVVSITDDDLPSVTVSYESSAYSVAESDDEDTTGVAENEVTIKVKLSADPEGMVTIPISKTDQGGATSADYSGVPADVVFNSGDTEKTFTFSATDDAVDDDGESVKLAFGTLPTSISAGSTNESVVSINDDDTAGVTVSPTELEVAEGAGGSYTVKLDTQPTGDVTITIDGTSGTDLTLNNTSLTFTKDNWSSAQTVTVSAGQDADALDDSATLTHTVASDDDTVYDDLAAPSLDVTVLDDETETKTITLTMAAPTHTDTDSSGEVDLGDTLAYTAVATNAGNVTLENVNVKDLLTDTSGTDCATLAIGAECKLTGVYTITQADVDAGEVKNTATANADGATPKGVTRTTDVNQIRKLTLEKTSTESGFGAKDDEISYSYKATNSGTVTLKGTLTVTDDKVDSEDITCPTVPDAGLAPGAALTCTATYTVTQDDVDEGKVKNTASAYLGGTTSAEVSLTVAWRAAQEGTPTISIGSAADLEDAGTISVTVRLSAASLQTVTVDYATSDGTATAGADYTAASGTVSFSPGDLTESVSVSITDDDIDEDTETIKITLSNPMNATVPAGAEEGAISITDDDTAGVTVSPTSLDITEGGNKTYTVVLDSEPAGDVTVTPGGITDTDLTLDKDSLTFTDSNWDTAQSVKVTVAHDDGSDDESATITHTVASDDDADYEGISAASVAVAITDDEDPQVKVSFEQSSYTVAEGSSVTVKVKLDADPERTVAIPLSKNNQGGASSSDYSGVPTSVTFNSGDTEKTFSFSATSDNVDDDGESVKLTFGSLPTGVSEDTTKETVVSITDDDVPSVTVSFENATYSVAESDDADTTDVSENYVTIKVKLSADPERTVTVPITKTDQGGATSADYSGVPTSVTFNSGDTEKSFTFAATHDTVDDDDEKVKLTFGTLPTRVSEGTTKEAVISINDDDVPRVNVSFGVGSYTVAEGGTVAVKVKLSKDPERTVVVPLTITHFDGVSGADYSGVPGSVTFQAGDTEKSFNFAAADDTVDDDGEYVLLGLGNLPARVSSATPSQTTVSITDDDVLAVTVSFDSATYSVDESDDASTTDTTENEVEVTVTLSEDPKRTVTIPITKNNQGGASNSDYSGVPTSVVFNSGDTEKSFTFSATHDTVDDDDESVKLTFSTLPTGVSEGTTKETIISITDDDVPAVTVSFGSATYSVAESDDDTTTDVAENEVTVTVKLSADPERTVTVPISKMDQDGASSADYSGVPASLVFNSGDTEKTFTFSATHDNVDDDGENVKLTFGTLPTRVQEGTPRETVVSITDDDSGRQFINKQITGGGDDGVAISFEQASYQVREGSTTVIKVTLSADPETDFSMPLTATDGTGLTSSDYSGLPDAVEFVSGETEKTFTLTAVQDQQDESDETLTIGFGPLLTGLHNGDNTQAVVTILDSVHASFDASTYQAYEGGAGALVTVELDQAAPAETVIPITATGMNGATADDWTGVPANLTFDAGDTEKSFTVMAYDDDVEDDGESVELTFGTLPAGVATGTPGTATVQLMNTEELVPPSCADAVWCADVEFADKSDDDWGRMDLFYHPNQDPGPEWSSISDDRFDFGDDEYFIWHVSTYPGVHPDILPRASASVPERSVFSITLGRWDSTQRFASRPKKEHYQDWILWVEGKAFPLSETDGMNGMTFVWLDETFFHLYSGWEEGKTYRLMIQDSPLSERPARVPNMPSAPRHLEVINTDQGLAALWHEPLEDGNSPVTHYLLQWKLRSDAWSDQNAVSEVSVNPPSSIHSFPGHLINGLTNEAIYDLRAIAVNAHGESPPSNEHFGMPQKNGLKAVRKTVNGDVVTLTYNHELDTTSVPDIERFIVLANGGLRPVDSVAISGRNVNLTLVSGVNAADRVVVNYIVPPVPDAGAIRDTTGRYAYTFDSRSTQQVVENLTDPAGLENLTAEFVGIPDDHDGAGDELRFKIRFSEPVRIDSGPPHGYLLDVEGGKVTSAWWVERDTTLWQIVLEIWPETPAD